MSNLDWFFLALATTLLAVSCNDAGAEEMWLKMGNSAKKEASSRVFGLGYQDTLVRGFIYQFEQDLLSIPSDRCHTTLSGSVRLGIKVDLDGLYATATTGPGYISQRDNYLGGYFQFVENVVLGIEDRFGTFGVGYQHISSAGIELPNKGRDYMFFQAGIKF